MGIFCILFDKKKQYFLILADVFNITGHKLLIALDENKAIELINLSKPEILLLDYEYFDLWLSFIKEEKYILPLFFVNSYEEGEKLLKKGFSDNNYVVLPFNPIELLTKMVNLHRDIEKIHSLSQIGLINLLIKVLSKGASAFLFVDNGIKTCILYIKNGKVTSISCSIDEFEEVLKTDIRLYLDVYDETKVEPKHFFKNNWELLSLLLAPEVAVLKEEPVQVIAPQAPEEKPVRVSVDLHQPVKIADGLFWVGVVNQNGLFQKNSYLCVYEKDNVKVPILVNIGTVQDYILIRTKVEQATGTMDALRAVVVFGSDVDECSGIVNLLQASQRAFVITSLSIAQKIKALGIPQEKIKTFETFPDGRLRLATGHILKFISTPFLPEAGSFVMLEENRGYLFSGKFLSSLSTVQEFDPINGNNIEDILLYTELMAPCQEVLKRSIEPLESYEIKLLLPAMGSPIHSSQEVRELFERLKLSSLSNVQKVYDRDIILGVCNNMIKDLKRALQSSEFQTIAEELSQYTVLEDDEIKELFIKPENLPSLILAIMFAKGVKPGLIKRAIKEFYSARLPFTI